MPPLAPLGAQARDSVVHTLAPGVVHRRLLIAPGPWEVNVLEVDLRRPGLSVELVHAQGELAGRQRPSEVARTQEARWCPGGRRVLGAVNGDLFDLATGENEGNQVVAGEVLKAGRITDSPWDTFDNAHAQFALDARGRPLIERFVFTGALLARTPRGDTVRAPLDGVNTARGGGAVLYTPASGARTPADSARGSVHEAPFAVVARRGDTLALRRIDAFRAGDRTPIPAAGVVLSVADTAAAAGILRDEAARDVIAVLRFLPDRGLLHTLVGGWGRLVAGGVAVGAQADSSEGTFPRFSASRHGRTAVGYSRDSATVYLATVDGRRAGSVGMSLAEWAATLRGLGAWDAVNLDGGGSSAMVVAGRVANIPSDSAGERAVGNVLLVTRRAARTACPRGGSSGGARTAPARRRPR